MREKDCHVTSTLLDIPVAIIASLEHLDMTFSADINFAISINCKAKTAVKNLGILNKVKRNFKKKTLDNFVDLS